MGFDLNNKIALVTGGSRGIGAAIAKRLAANGAKVAFTYAGNKTAADEVVAAILAKGGSAQAFQANAADPAAAVKSVQSTIDAFGGLDILVHNAGIAIFTPIDADSFENFRQQFSVNVDGVFAATRAAVDVMRDGGRVIVIGSVNAHAMPTAGGAVYGATKAAVAGLVRGWARDLGARGILVNAVQPGPIDTDLNPAAGEYAAMLTPLTALKRYGRSEEVAAVTAFLASAESSYVTGTTIDVDGGFSI